MAQTLHRPSKPSILGRNYLALGYFVTVYDATDITMTPT